MAAERIENSPEFRVGEIHIPVQGLVPETVFDDRTNREVKVSNLADPDTQSRIAEILSKPRYEGLVEGVKSGTKMAFSKFDFARNDAGDLQLGFKITVVTLGTVAAAAAYEFGIRHGQDIRELIDIFKPQDSQK